MKGFKLLTYFASHKTKIAILAVSAVFMAIISAFTPFVNRYLIDVGLAGKNLNATAMTVLLLCAISIIYSLLSFLQIKLGKTLS